MFFILLISLLSYNLINYSSDNSENGSIVEIHNSKEVTININNNQTNQPFSYIKYHNSSDDSEFGTSSSPREIITTMPNSPTNQPKSSSSTANYNFTVRSFSPTPHDPLIHQTNNQANNDRYKCLTKGFYGCGLVVGTVAGVVTIVHLCK